MTGKKGKEYHTQFNTQKLNSQRHPGRAGARFTSGACVK
jgi:hypothetical protein